MIEQLNTIAGVWWNWATAMFWQVSLLIVLIACIDRLTRRWTWPQLRYALWSLVLIKLILPPTLSLPSSVAPRLTPMVTEAWSTVTEEQPADVPAPLRVLSVEAVSSPAVAYAPSFSPETELTSAIALQPSGSALDWRVYALGVWLAGAAGLAGFLVFRLRSLSQADKRASKAPPLPESFYNQLSGCAGRLGLRHLPRVVVTDKVPCPAVFGVLRPVLLMPRGCLERLSRRDTEHMLLHELAHVKRGDLLAHGFYMLLQVVYWYNPLLWLVRRQIHHLRELCCDATVAGLLRADTGAYRQTLLKTARRFLATRTEPGLGLLGLFEDSNRLLIRLNWLNKPTWRYRRMKRAFVIAIVGLMLACVLPMAHSQPPVPTAPPEPAEVAEVEVAETPTTEMNPEQFARQMAQLEQQMQKLQQQRQQFERQMQQMHLQMAQLHQQRAQFVRDAKSDALFQTYTVREGDTLAGIARRFSASDDTNQKETIDCIMKANELASADALRVGQHLRIPLSEEQAERITRQLDAAEQRVHGALVETEHALSEAERNVAGAQTHVRATSTSTTRSRVPLLGDLPLMGQVMTDVPEADKVLDVSLPEHLPLAQLLDLVGSHTNLNFVYDPEVVTGDVAVRIAGGRQGEVRVRDLYRLLESALEIRGLALVQLEGNLVAILPKEDTPKPTYDLLDMVPPENPPEPTIKTAVDADYVVKALKPGTELRIQNNIGSLKIQGGAGRDCAIRVKIEAKGTSSEQAEEIAKQVLIQVTPTDEIVEVGVQFPDEMSKQQRESVQVHFDMNVPRDCIVRAMQNVGDISLAGLGDSAVQAKTNVGTIRTRDLQRNVSLMVNVGDIEMVMPSDPSAKVRATSKIGAIKSDLPLDITSASVMRAGQAQSALGSSASGILGAGQGKVDLATNVGSIRIRSAADSPGS